MADWVKPSFEKDESLDFFIHLRSVVKDLASSLYQEKKGIIRFKAFFFPFLYLSLYAAILIFGTNTFIFYLCFALMGLSILLVFLNTIHDAAHGVLFESQRLNKLYLYFFDLIGANSFSWRIRHTRLHHNYPNVMGYDSDIEQSPLARIYPHGNYSVVHKYQHIYLPFLYPLYLFNWLLVRDFKDFFNKNKLLQKVTDIPFKEYVKLFLFKIIFLSYTIMIPKIMLDIGWGQAILGFVVMVFTASCFSLIVLLSPHANEEAEFPLPDENNKLPHNFYLHQIMNTNDVSTDNWFTRFFLGCFNYHVAHHLFQDINHVCYPEVTALLKEELGKSGFTYRSYPLFSTLKMHYSLLKKNRKPFEIFEETM